MIPVVFINGKDISYVDLIIQGKKRYETRSRNMLGALVGRRVLIAETGKGKPRIRCSAVIEDASKIDFLYNWELIRGVTCVPEGSAHDWDYQHPGKWIYELADVREVFDMPWKEGKRHGITWMEYEDEDLDGSKEDK